MSAVNFTVTELVGYKYLVEGTDQKGNEGSEVISGAGYERLVASLTNMTALITFDEDVQDFFAPITDAADKLEEARQATDRLEERLADPNTYGKLIIESKVDAVEAKPEQSVSIDRDTAILLILDPAEIADALQYPVGQTSAEKLLWVNGTLHLVR